MSYSELKTATLEYLSLKYGWFDSWFNQATLFKVCHRPTIFKFGTIINEIYGLIPAVPNFNFPTNNKHENANISLKELRQHIQDIYPKKNFDDLTNKQVIYNIIGGIYSKHKKQFKSLIKKIELFINAIENEFNFEIPDAPELINQTIPDAPALDITKLPKNTITGLDELTHEFNDDLDVISFTDQIESVPLFTQTIDDINKSFKTETAKSNVSFADMPYRDKADLNMDDYKEQQKRYNQFESKNKKPVVERESYRIKTVEQLKQVIFESLTKASLPSKVNVDLHMIVESKYNKDSKKHSAGETHYTIHKLNPLVTLDHNKDKTITKEVPTNS